MKCADCKYYVEKDSELTDECHHESAKTSIGIEPQDRGIRSEPKPQAFVYFPCYATLAGICKDHQLFEPKVS